MKTPRTSRLNGEYQKEISVILRRVKDRNPQMKGLISVTETDVAPDLKTAYVYVSIYGVNETEATSVSVTEISPFIVGFLSFTRRKMTLISF